MGMMEYRSVLRADMTTAVSVVVLIEDALVWLRLVLVLGHHAGTTPGGTLGNQLDHLHQRRVYQTNVAAPTIKQTLTMERY